MVLGSTPAWPSTASPKQFRYSKMCIRGWAEILHTWLDFVSGIQQTHAGCQTVSWEFVAKDSNPKQSPKAKWADGFVDKGAEILDVL
jgi:hypothetical protein